MASASEAVKSGSLGSVPYLKHGSSNMWPSTLVHVDGIMERKNDTKCVNKYTAKCNIVVSSPIAEYQK